MTKPFKTVTIEYFEEYSIDPNDDYEFDNGTKFKSETFRRIKAVTTESKWIGSTKDPIIATTYEYL